MTIAAVIFDRDNTLVRFDQTALAALAGRIRACAPTLPVSSVIEHWQTWPGPWPAHPAEEPSFWRQFWMALATDYALSPAETRTLCEIGAVYHTFFTAYDDTLHCLMQLRRAGLRLAVLTNFELPSIDRTLAHAGIDPALFDITLSSASLGLRKPDPRAFRAAAAALGVSPARCAFVDDVPEHVIAARTLGMRALQIDRTRSTHDLGSDLICTLEPLPQVLLPPSLHD